MLLLRLYTIALFILAVSLVVLPILGYVLPMALNVVPAFTRSVRGRIGLSEFAGVGLFVASLLVLIGLVLAILITTSTSKFYQKHSNNIKNRDSLAELKLDHKTIYVNIDNAKNALSKEIKGPDITVNDETNKELYDELKKRIDEKHLKNGKFSSKWQFSFNINDNGELETNKLTILFKLEGTRYEREVTLMKEELEGLQKKGAWYTLENLFLKSVQNQYTKMEKKGKESAIVVGLVKSDGKSIEIEHIDGGFAVSGGLNNGKQPS